MAAAAANHLDDQDQTAADAEKLPTTASGFTAVNGGASAAPGPATSGHDELQGEPAESTRASKTATSNTHPASGPPEDRLPSSMSARQDRSGSQQDRSRVGRAHSPATQSTPPSAPVSHAAPAASMISAPPTDRLYSPAVLPPLSQGSPDDDDRAQSMGKGATATAGQHPETMVMSPQKRKRSFSQERDNVHAGVFPNGGMPSSPDHRRLSHSVENGQTREREREPYSPRHTPYHHPSHEIYPPPPQPPAVATLPHDGYPPPTQHAYPPPSQERSGPDLYPRTDHHPSMRNTDHEQPVDPSIAGGEAARPPYYGPDAHMAEVLQRENRNYDAASRDQYGTPEDDDDPPYGEYGGGRGSQSGMDMDRKRRKRVFSNRTKTGCMTCRRRKKKCDEQHPECNNCLRGGFVCEGYTVRQSWQKPANAKVPVPLQSKNGYPSQGTPSRASYSGPPPYSEDDYPGPSQPPAQAHRHSYDGGRRNESMNMEDERDQFYGRTSSPPTQKTPAAWGKGSRPYPSHPPQASKYLDGEHRGSIFETSESQDPNHMGPPPINRSTSSQSQYSQPSHPPGHNVTPPSHASVQAKAQAALTHPISLRPSPSRRSENFTEREKMLKGMYYYPMTPALTEDRERCIAAIWRFNNATNPSHGASPEERSRLFRQILSLRPSSEPPLSSGEAPPTNFSLPFGSVGERVVVEAPFHCDYGYNITIGDDVLLGADCRISDTCSVNIGARCIFSPNVKLVCATYPIDPRRRMGSNGPALGRNIVIEEDCWIGANVTILAGVRVGKSSTVGAGSLLHQDVPPFTVVAGNPAKVSRGIYDGSNDRH